MSKARWQSRSAATAALALVVTLLLPAASVLTSPGSALTVSTPSQIVSEQTFDLTVFVSDGLAALGYTDDPSLSGAMTELFAWRDESWLSVAARPVNGPTVTYPVTVWKTDKLLVRLILGDKHLDSDPVDVTASPQGQRVTSQLPEPQVPYPSAPRSVGSGGNATVQEIPHDLWRAMKNVSWQPGCPVGRSRLRLIEVNYWGFDGYRYRGRIVVAKRIARQVAGIFTELHDVKYPIRQMRLPDVFGKSKHRGATDYASMGADNTSGFNCRYVVGRERHKILSPHAYGTAVDVNPWENPYKSPIGVLPEPAWARGPNGHPAVLRDPKHPAVRAFTSRGATWGGHWRAFDWHHFEW